MFGAHDLPGHRHQSRAAHREHCHVNAALWRNDNVFECSERLAGGILHLYLSEAQDER